MKKIGFIGAGNMGGAIVSSVVNKAGFDPSDIYVCDKALRADIAALGVNVASAEDTVRQSDVIVLAVKPNMMPGVLADIRQIGTSDDKLFVSIAAGLTTQMISDGLGCDKVIRVMPNLCLTAGEGMSVLCARDSVNDEEMDFVCSIFASCGKTAKVEEKLIDSCTAINGSGPAYVFMFMEAMADAAVKHGIDRKTAYALTAQTVLGSAAMMLESGLHPGVLKDMVCSPGGTTIEAVQALEDAGLRSAVMAAVDACAKKAADMKK